MDKTKSPQWATIILFGIVSIVALLIVVSVFLVAFSPSPKMTTARQRWRERAAASVCQKIMERSDCKSYGGRVMDCTGRVLACVENRYDLYFDCCATRVEKWNKSAPELAGRLANVLPYRTQNQWRAYLEDGRKLRRRYLPIAKNLGSLELMMLEGLPLMSTRSREGGVVETRRIATYPNGDVGRRVLGYYRETTGNGVGIIGDNYERLFAGEDVLTTLDSRWQSAADALLRNGYIDLAHCDDVLGVCMVVGDLHEGDIKAMINLLKDRPNHFSEDYNFALGFRYDPASHFSRKYVSPAIISELNAIDSRYQALGGDSLQISPVQLLACLSRSVNEGKMVAPRLLQDVAVGAVSPDVKSSEAHVEFSSSGTEASTSNPSATPFPDRNSMDTFEEDSGLVGSLGISRQEIDRGHSPAMPVYCHSFAGIWTEGEHDYGIVCMILSKKERRGHLEVASLFASTFSNYIAWQS